MTTARRQRTFNVILAVTVLVLFLLYAIAVWTNWHRPASEARVATTTALPKPAQVREVENVTINAQGDLVLTFSDGETSNVGRVIGSAGLQGQDGRPGRDGAKGDQGPKGEPGDKGDVGNQGAQGANGVKGQVGEPGPQGLQGPVGAIGPVGPQGTAGQDGETPQLRCLATDSGSTIQFKLPSQANWVDLLTIRGRSACV